MGQRLKGGGSVALIVNRNLTDQTLIKIATFLEMGSST